MFFSSAFFLIFFGFAFLPCGLAQTVASTGEHHGTGVAVAGDVTMPAIFISDIHFDPFHDPGKVEALANAPVGQWKAILSSSASADQGERFLALQQGCHARGVDTPFSLLESSLQAMRMQRSDASFVSVSGDLIAHAFSCRYKTLFPQSPQAAYEGFILKTFSFVESELRNSFPGKSLYVALGNNDSPCGDYRLDAGGDFLAKAGRIIAEGLPTHEQRAVTQEFAHGGYYSVMMDGPMAHTKLIVLDDVFMSPRFATCKGNADSGAATAELQWVESQLAEAEQAHETVWVMGHIPPGVDPYSTISAMKDVCGHEASVMFLSSDALGHLLVQHAGVVRLGIFGHTHTDEMRLLRPEGLQSSLSGEHAVALKLVPSISPVDGNNPSFTVALINPSTAMLINYKVIAGSNQTGIDTAWTEEYDYAATYHQPEFSPAALATLISGFVADSKAAAEPSTVYLRNYFVGDRSLLLKPFWPEYVCALPNVTARAFAKCVCTSVH